MSRGYTRDSEGRFASTGGVGGGASGGGSSGGAGGSGGGSSGGGASSPEQKAERERVRAQVAAQKREKARAARAAKATGGKAEPERIPDAGLKDKTTKVVEGDGMTEIQITPHTREAHQKSHAALSKDSTITQDGPDATVFKRWGKDHGQDHLVVVSLKKPKDESGSSGPKEHSAPSRDDDFAEWSKRYDANEARRAEHEANVRASASRRAAAAQKVAASDARERVAKAKEASAKEEADMQAEFNRRWESRVERSQAKTRKAEEAARPPSRDPRMPNSSLNAAAIRALKKTR